MGPAILASLLVGACIALGGAVSSLVAGRQPRSLAALLGFPGGLVLGIAGLEAMPSAVAIAGLGWASLGFLAGTGAMVILHRLLHHRQRSSPAAHAQQRWLRAGLLAGAGVVLHNVMDGVGIGAGFAHEAHLGWVMAAAVLLHNLPVGLLIGLPLCLGRVAPGRVMAYTLLAGLITPVGALLGSVVSLGSPAGLTLGLSLAAGSLFYIISRELLPLALAQHRLLAATATLLGLAAAAAGKLWL
ncbi:MAG: ZIP family metal transporter [bacterium]|nr:ZIP family metal transporter [bacterium]